MLPTRPSVMSQLSPYPPRFITHPASKPASTPARIHIKNVMTSPPSSSYGGLASLPKHRRARCTLSRSISTGPARPQRPRRRSGCRPIAVLLHQKGREHFDRPLVEGPIVDHHLYGGTRETPDPFGRRGGADDNVRSPHQATQRGPLGGADPYERDVRQVGVRDRVLQVVGRLDGGGGDAHPCSRRELGQTVEGLEMRLGEQRDHGNPLTLQKALHLREMTEARDRCPPPTGLLRAPCDRRQLGEEHFLDTDRQVGLELPGKEIELRRAALDQKDLDGPADRGRPDSGQAQNAHRQVVGRHPESRGPYHRILQEGLAEVRGGPGWRRRGHEHAPPPPRLHVSKALQVVDDTRDGVWIDAEESSQLPDAGQRLVPRDAAALDGVAKLLHQLEPDRDRAVPVYPQIHRVHTV